MKKKKQKLENENKNKHENKNEFSFLISFSFLFFILFSKSFCIFFNCTGPRGAIDGQPCLTWPTSAIAFSIANFSRGLAVL